MTGRAGQLDLKQLTVKAKDRAKFRVDTDRYRQTPARSPGVAGSQEPREEHPGKTASTFVPVSFPVFRLDWQSSRHCHFGGTWDLQAVFFFFHMIAY